MKPARHSLIAYVVVILHSGDAATWGASPAGATVPWSTCKAEQGVTIRHASFSAINVDDAARGGLLDATLAENSIESPGGDAILIHDAVRGKLSSNPTKSPA